MWVFFLSSFNFEGGSEFKFEFSSETGDWSLLQKSSGNKNGGHKRCPLCGLDFAPDNIHQCFSYTNIISQIPKSISLSVKLFSTPTESNDKMKEILGYKQIAALFSSVTPQERLILMKEVVKDSKVAIDNLHNIKGHLSKIVEMERDHPQFNDGLFITNLNEFLGRSSTAKTDMNGESHRKLAILFKEVLLPCVAPDRREAYRALYDNWLEIQFLMYDLGELALTDPVAIGKVKDRMHACTFVHLQQVRFFWYKRVRKKEMEGKRKRKEVGIKKRKRVDAFRSYVLGKIIVWDRDTRPVFSCHSGPCSFCFRM